MSARGSDRHDAESPGSRIGKLLYPMRILGTGTCALITYFYVGTTGTWTAYHATFVVLLLVYPHLAYLLNRALGSSRNVELGGLLVDAYILGTTVYISGFSLLPALILIMVALTNGMALNGPRQMALTAAFVLLSMALPMAFAGLNFHPKDVPGINLICAVFLFVYFQIFAYTAYRRSMILQGSRAELRQRNVAIEIEKRKSDQLLLSIVPEDVAHELRARGGFAPRSYERVSLLVAEIVNFTEVAAALDPADLLAELNHCWKAFDALAARYHLEPLKALAGVYVAVGGLGAGTATPATHAADAVRAALEVRERMRELAEARTAHGRPFLTARVLVHTGSVVAGVIEARRFGYDVWGEAVEVARHVRGQLAPNQVAITAATRELVPDLPGCTPAGTVATAGGPMALYLVEASGAGGSAAAA